MTTKCLLTNIWRWNATAGYWALVRDAYPENVARWLDILSGDEPGTVFKASRKRPVKAPAANVANAQVGVERRAASVAAMVKVGVDQPHDHARLAFDNAAIDIMWHNHAALLGRDINDRA